MSRQTCFDSQRALHDPRLHRMLTGYEFRHFFQMLCFVNAECRDPAFIPARLARWEEGGPAPRLALELGLNRALYERRLEKWSRERIELIEVQADGGLLLTYVLDQDDEDDPEIEEAARAGTGNGMNSNGTPRQPRRRYSMAPSAIRARDAYRRRQAAQNGETLARNGEMSAAQNGEVSAPPAREVLGENLTPGEYKPHASTLGFAGAGPSKPNEMRAGLREVPRVRVDIDSEQEISLKSSESRVDIDIDAENANLTKPHASNLTLPAPSTATLPPAANDPPAPTLPDGASSVRVRRKLAVDNVLKCTGDSPANRGLWIMYWNACNERGQLPLWDQAISMLATEMKRSVVPIRVPASWLQTCLRNLLEAAGVFLPRQEELREAEERGEGADWIREQVRQSMGLAAPGEGQESFDADA